MAKFEEGLGRVMYVTGALEHERTFMAPLYKLGDHPPAPLSAGSALVRLPSSRGSLQVKSSRGVFIHARCRPFRRKQPREWTRRRRQSE